MTKVVADATSCHAIRAVVLARDDDGYCAFLNKKMSVRPNIAPAQAVKTLVRELGHALLHGDEVARSREIQRSRWNRRRSSFWALGMASDDYSFLYRAMSDGDAELLKTTGERAISCATRILTGQEVGA